MASFTRDDVVEIYGIQEGENDADPWRVYGLLKDGRYFYLEAGCDYTGWGCQEDGRSWVNSTKEGIIKEGLTEEARRIFKLVEDNVGTIRVKGLNTDNLDGLTKITREYKKTSTKMSLEEIKEKINEINRRQEEEWERHDKISSEIDADYYKILKKCPHDYNDVGVCRICNRIKTSKER